MGRMRGIAAGLLESAARRNQDASARRGRSGAVDVPPAPIGRMVEHEAGRQEHRAQRRRVARRRALADTRSPSVLSLARPRPSLPCPCPMARDRVAGGEPFSFSEGLYETPREGEGPPSAAPVPLRCRVVLPHPSRVRALYRGRSFFSLLQVALLCVGCALVCVVWWRVGVLAGRLAALEGGGVSVVCEP